MKGFISWFGAILSRHPDYEIHPLAYVVGCLAVFAISLFPLRLLSRMKRAPSSATAKRVRCTPAPMCRSPATPFSMI